MPTISSVFIRRHRSLVGQFNFDSVYFPSLTGWSFILAAIGVVALIVSSLCFLTEATVHEKKIRQLKESQARFELERDTKSQEFAQNISVFILFSLSLLSTFFVVICQCVFDGTHIQILHSARLLSSQLVQSHIDINRENNSKLAVVTFTLLRMTTESIHK